MTLDEVVDLAFARIGEHGITLPRARSPLYRRIGLRQMALAREAARVNPEYYGVAAIATLDDSAADLNDIDSPVPIAETLQKIVVDTVGGAATVAAGAEVSIVRVGDEAAEVAPRVTLRSGVLRGVGTDLDGVLTLKVYYARLPDLPAADTDGTTETFIAEPHAELLVIDCAKAVVETSTGEYARLLAALDTEEARTLAAFLAHAADYGRVRSRFAR